MKQSLLLLLLFVGTSNALGLNCSDLSDDQYQLFKQCDIENSDEHLCIFKVPETGQLAVGYTDEDSASVSFLFDKPEYSIDGNAMTAKHFDIGLTRYSFFKLKIGHDGAGKYSENIYAFGFLGGHPMDYEYQATFNNCQ